MEGKWDLDFYDGKLYFSRSWTGDLILMAETANENSDLTIALVHCQIRRDDQAIMAVRDVDFLVKTYVFGRELPHSIPANIPPSEKQILTYSFNKFGREASFATYDDTLMLTI
jgi:hypothetical protein